MSSVQTLSLKSFVQFDDKDEYEDDEEKFREDNNDMEEAEEDNKEEDVHQINQIQNSQLWSLIETWGFREDISLMTRTKMRMMTRRSRTTRRTMRRLRRMTITKPSSVLPFRNHKLKPN